MIVSCIIWSLLLAGFAAFVARRHGRNPWTWFLIGLIPIVGIVLVFAAGEPAEEPSEHAKIIKLRRERREANPRCKKHYEADCHACPFFRKPMFFGNAHDTEAGYCEKFKRTLWKDDSRRADG